MKGLRPLVYLIRSPPTKQEGIDLIYEGITTCLIRGIFAYCDKTKKELTWFMKGLRQVTNVKSLVMIWCPEGIDLIYEGITTLLRQ